MKTYWMACENPRYGQTYTSYFSEEQPTDGGGKCKISDDAAAFIEANKEAMAKNSPGNWRIDRHKPWWFVDRCGDCRAVVINRNALAGLSGFPPGLLKMVADLGIDDAGVCGRCKKKREREQYVRDHFDD
jgi:hypothetical protein